MKWPGLVEEEDEATGGGGGIPFSPPDIPGLKLWLKYNTLSALHDGDTIATWPDSSGNGNDATNVGFTPVIYKTIGLPVPVASFDGNMSFFRLPIGADFQLSSVDPMSIFIVATPQGDGVSGDSMLFAHAENGGGFIGWYVVRRHNGGGQARTPFIGYNAPAGNSWEVAFNAPLDVNVRHVLNWNKTAVPTVASFSFRLDNSPVAPIINTNIGTADPLNLASPTVGSRDGAGVPYLGYISELLFYRGALTPTQINSVYSYLKTNNGL